MLFQHVAIAGLAHVDAPRRLGSDEIHARLKPTLDRLGIKTDMLRDIAGIHARRLWDGEMQASSAATLAGVKALADAGIDPDKVGLLVNTSVSRDFLEPSTASIVSGNLGLSEMCQNFDVANACLAFLNGMDIASRMIERGEIDYALVVDGETADLAYEKTLERMDRADLTEAQFRNEMATLTLGSGAAAMVLARAELAPGAPRYRGAHPHAADRRAEACAEDLHRGEDRTGMGGGGDGRVRHPPGQPGAYNRVHQGVRHRSQEGAHDLRRARQHRPRFGPDRAEQAARTRAVEERRSRRATRDRLGVELLDGGSRLVSHRA